MHGFCLPDAGADSPVPAVAGAFYTHFHGRVECVVCLVPSFQCYRRYLCGAGSAHVDGRGGKKRDSPCVSLSGNQRGNRLCSASQEAVITVDREGRVSATVVNAAFHRKKPVDFSSFGPCSEAVLFSSDTVLPPSSFTQSNVLDQAAGGTLQMPPHSVLFLRF